MRQLALGGTKPGLAALLTSQARTTNITAKAAVKNRCITVSFLKKLKKVKQIRPDSRRNLPPPRKNPRNMQQ
jgi:hypothetical protein